VSSGLPTGAIGDRRGWTSSLAIGIGFAIAFSVHSLVGGASIPFLPAWPVAADTWSATAVAHAIGHGLVTHLYSTGGYDGLPLWPIVLTPVVALADALGLRSGPTARPAMAQLVLPYSLAVGVLVLHAGRSLAWALGTRRRLWLIQLCLAVSVILPCAVAGHMEDALAVALLLYAVRGFRAGDLDTSALLLTLAISSKQWAVLVVPLLVLLAPPASRVRFALLAVSVPVLLGAVALSLDFHDAYWLLLAPSALTHNPGVRLGVMTAFGARVSRLARPLVLGAAVLVAMFSRRRGTAVLLPTLAGLLLLRPLLEPLLFAYYVAPGVAMLTMIAVAGTDRPSLTDLLWPVLVTLWTFQGNMTAPLWWAGAVVLVAMASRPALRSWRGAVCVTTAPGAARLRPEVSVD